jgi:hypothetical protein
MAAALALACTAGDVNDSHRAVLPLERVARVDEWMSARLHGLRTVRPPPWLVTSKSQLRTKMVHVADGFHKKVFSSKIDVGGALVPVVIKAPMHTPPAHSQNRVRKLLFSQLYFEVLFFEYLRGRPGIPTLYGAWFEQNGTALHYVVDDGGEKFADAKPARLLPKATVYATSHPIAFARSLLRCFWSFAELGGGILSDFNAAQFMMNERHEVSIIDSPHVNEGALHAYLKSKYPAAPPHEKGKLTFEWYPLWPRPRACSTSDSCAHTREGHCCCQGMGGTAQHGKCDPRSRAAPESRGICPRAGGTCVQLSAKTHVHDVAAMAFLLPQIIEAAALPADKRLLGDLGKRMAQALPEARPSFAEALQMLGGSNGSACHPTRVGYSCRRGDAADACVRDQACGVRELGLRPGADRLASWAALPLNDAAPVQSAHANSAKSTPKKCKTTACARARTKLKGSVAVLGSSGVIKENSI